MRHLVAAAKAAHERLMTDECEISRVSQGSFDDTTGLRAAVSIPVYSGPCRVKVAPVQLHDSAERNNVITQPVLVLPADDTTVISERDVCEVTDSANPNLIGVSFSIIGADLSTTGSARRFLMEARA